jgi:hypothetical protein
MLLSVFSCDQNEDALSTKDLGNVEYFVFGVYYGHCLGNCAHVYKLQGNKLFADKLDRGYPEPGITFESNSRPAADVALAQQLLADFPADLRSEESETIGCPDCADQGGYYLEIKQEGKVSLWRIDTDESRIPKYLSAYTAKIAKILEDLE